MIEWSSSGQPSQRCSGMGTCSSLGICQVFAEVSTRMFDRVSTMFFSTALGAAPVQGRTEHAGFQDHEASKRGRDNGSTHLPKVEMIQHPEHL